MQMVSASVPLPVRLAMALIRRRIFLLWYNVYNARACSRTNARRAWDSAKSQREKQYTREDKRDPGKLFCAEAVCERQGASSPVADAESALLLPTLCGCAGEGLLSLIKDMYQDGDPDTKRAIAQAWSKVCLSSRPPAVLLWQSVSVRVYLGSRCGIVFAVALPRPRMVRPLLSRPSSRDAGEREERCAWRAHQ